MSEKKDRESGQVENLVRHKIGDKIKFNGCGFLGDDVFDAEIIEINNNSEKKYRAKMSIGYVVYLNDDDICA